MMVSIIIPTYNGAKRIGKCLEALTQQDYQGEFEIIVVDDGSTDETEEVVQQYPQIRLIQQQNAGPASARNQGARVANGEILLLTDDDCVPMPDWISQMVQPFLEKPELVGIKGVYRTHQRELTARFVQLEYEDKYDVMAKYAYIDFIDTYSAGYRRDIFLKYDGFDTTFPVACTEDQELSFRIGRDGHKMKFIPQAIVYHTHPNSVLSYIKKKYKFAFWKMLALQKNPEKLTGDTHTPQTMKVQLLLGPTMLGALAAGLYSPVALIVFYCLAISFFATTIPFAIKSFYKDKWLAPLTPFFLLIRSLPQFFGVMAGSVWVATQSWRKPKVT
jgi:glycosyltransferase involved in cell wall biosynthesis